MCACLADALHLPFPGDTFPGVTAIYVLYFFDEPASAVAEALRVLQTGGLFGACAPSRFDCPELDHVLPAASFEETFTSEDIPGVLDDRFERVQITAWDAPMFDLPDRATVADYLFSHYYPLFTREQAAAASERVKTPLKLTKKGAWGTGRKRSRPAKAGSRRPRAVHSPIRSEMTVKPGAGGLGTCSCAWAPASRWLVRWRRPSP